MLRRVRNVIRARRVRRIESNAIVFEDGGVPAPPDALYIDCTARAISFRPPVPVFDGPRITLQFIRDGRISFSAAAIGYAEATIDDERRKNTLCAPIPYEEHLVTWPKAVLAELRNGEAWAKDPAMRAWARQHRLAGFTTGGAPSPELEALRKRISEPTRPY